MNCWTEDIYYYAEQINSFTAASARVSGGELIITTNNGSPRTVRDTDTADAVYLELQREATPDHE